MGNVYEVEFSYFDTDEFELMTRMATVGADSPREARKIFYRWHDPDCEIIRIKLKRPAAKQRRKETI